MDIPLKFFYHQVIPRSAKRMIGLCFACILLTLQPVFCQTHGIIKGKITDVQTQEPLSGCSIEWLNGTAIGQTDNNGLFQITLDSGHHVLVFHHTGYRSDTCRIQIQPNALIELKRSLQPAGKLLETIVITSGKFAQKLEEVTVSMEVLKPGLIQNKNTTSIETALEQVPGLTIIDNDPQIRGGSGFTFGVGSRVAIVVDGIPLLSGDAGRPEWSYIPVENIEQIEVIKGASSVLYGSSALSGVINIRSAYPKSKPKTILNVSTGTYSKPGAPASDWYGNSLPGFVNLNFLHTCIIKKQLDFVLGANFNTDQGYIGPPPPAPDMPQDLREALRITDTIPTFSNRDLLRVRGRVNFNLRYRSPKVTGLSFGINGNGMLHKTNMVFAWNNDTDGLYKGYPGAVFLQDQQLFNLDPFIKYNNGKGVVHSLVTRIFHSNNIITNNQSNRGTLYYGEYQLQRRFLEQNLTFTGGVVSNTSTSFSKLYAASGSPNNRISNASVYLQMDKKLWNILNMSGGIRYEYFKMNRTPSVVAPIFRAGASLQVLEGTFLRTSYGQGFRYPTITERFISTKAGLFGVFPNPGLEPETSKSFEIGLKQGFKLGSVMGYLDLAGFFQKYEQTIEYLFGVWDPSISLVGFKFQNTGNSRVRGIDVSLVLSSDSKNKKSGITALLGYTNVEAVSLTPDAIYALTQSIQPGAPGIPLSYKNSSMDTTGNFLKYRFKHMAKADVEWKLAGCLHVGFSYRYYSKMQNIDKAFEDIEELTSNAAPYLSPLKVVDYWKRHKHFHILDLRLGWNMKKDQKIALICANLLNADYALRPLKIEAPRSIALQYVLNL